VGGNGGAKPRHAELFARDVPPSEVIPILDRYLMFYIRTADRLQRTARWMEALPGGLKYLQEVILEDKLGICESLESQMQELVDSFFDEWAEAINTPSIAKKFRQFHNTTEETQNMEIEPERGQARPVFWPSESAEEDFKGLKEKWSSMTWEPVIEAKHFDGADDMPNGISANIKRGDTQLAVWRYRGKFYATQQMCPHKRAFVLSDGLLGQDPNKSCDKEKTGSGEGPQPSAAPWVSCPHHKRNFDLSSGACKTDTALSIATFPVEVRPEDGMLYLQLPPVEELDAELGTKKWKVKKGDDNGEGMDKFKELDKKINFVGRRGKKPGVKPTINGAAGTMMKRPVELMAGGCGSAPDW
jgi:nitrite reductase (NAD(P)H)